MKIVWTEPAVEDLRELHAYIARDSEVYAIGFVERIILAVEQSLTIHESVASCRKKMTKTFANFFIKITESSIASRATRLNC
jgi:plasmid stabilization system protein ParE